MDVRQDLLWSSSLHGSCRRCDLGSNRRNSEGWNGDIFCVFEKPIKRMCLTLVLNFDGFYLNIWHWSSVLFQQKVLVDHKPEGSCSLRDCVFIVPKAMIHSSGNSQKSWLPLQWVVEGRVRGLMQSLRCPSQAEPTSVFFPWCIGKYSMEGHLGESITCSGGRLDIEAQRKVPLCP